MLYTGCAISKEIRLRDVDAETAAMRRKMLKSGLLALGVAVFLVLAMWR